MSDRQDLLFKLALGWIFDAEGGDADHPDDRGGRTRYGISQAAYPNINVASLTRDHAAKLYERDYWLKACCDKLPAGLAIAHFDGAVQHGPTTAIRLLQRALGVQQDGVFGQITLAAALRQSGAAVTKLLAVRGLYYHDIVQNDASQRVFLKGWLHRLFRLQAQIGVMCHALG